MKFKRKPQMKFKQCDHQQPNGIEQERERERRKYLLNFKIENLLTNYYLIDLFCEILLMPYRMKYRLFSSSIVTN